MVGTAHLGQDKWDWRAETGQSGHVGLTERRGHDLMDRSLRQCLENTYFREKKVQTLAKLFGEKFVKANIIVKIFAKIVGKQNFRENF